MRVPINKIRIGDRLGADIFNERGLLVLSAATMLTDEDIEKLHLHRIDEADIAIRVEDLQALAPDPVDLQALPRLASRYFGQAAERILSSYTAATQCIREMFIHVATDGYVTGEQIDSGFNPLMTHVHEEKDVVSLLLVLNSQDDYTYQHSVQVGLLSYYIAKWMGQTEDEARIAGKAGYLHDIGKSLVEPDILRKPSKLTDSEFSHIKKHTLLGYNILKRSHLPEEVCFAALQHHERLDGTGYPLQLSESEIHPMAKIVAVADIYSAMISSRVYQKKRDLLYVLRELHRCSFGELDPTITQIFIRNMIPNFIGKSIQLANGEVGTIVMTHPTDFFRPLIQVNGHFIDLTQRADLEVEHIFA